MSTNHPKHFSDWATIHQQVWELHQQGWSNEKIADALNITSGAASQWIKRQIAEEERKIESLARHFGVASIQNLHLFRPEIDISAVELYLARTAKHLNFHWAILDGTNINDERVLLEALGHVYNLPKLVESNYETLNWNSIADYFADLSWIVGSPGEQHVEGFILLYKQPAPLYLAAGPVLATFLDAMLNGVQYLQEDAIPFHIVIAPVIYPLEFFIGLLKRSEHVCTACQVILNTSFVP